MSPIAANHHDVPDRLGPPADDRQRHMYESAARARDRLAAVRPAIARLRGALGRMGADRELIELPVDDVVRALVCARRSMRALTAELAALEAESRDVLHFAAQTVGR